MSLRASRLTVEYLIKGLNKTNSSFDKNCGNNLYLESRFMMK